MFLFSDYHNQQTVFMMLIVGYFRGHVGHAPPQKNVGILCNFLPLVSLEMLIEISMLAIQVSDKFHDHAVDVICY